MEEKPLRGKAVLTRVEWAKYDETGDQYASIFEVDPKGELKRNLGTGAGSNKEEALDKAIEMARNKKRIGEDDLLLQIEERDAGRVDFDAGLRNLQRAGAIDQGGTIEAKALWRGTRGEG